jgi:hypothetical protein
MALDATAGGMDDLLRLVHERIWYLEDSEEPGAEHAREQDLIWWLSAQDWGFRFSGLLRVRRGTPAEAVSDALHFRDEVLATGYCEAFKCVVAGVRIADEEDNTLGWHGRFDLGLLREPPDQL